MHTVDETSVCPSCCLSWLTVTRQSVLCTGPTIDRQAGQFYSLMQETVRVHPLNVTTTSFDRKNIGCVSREQEACYVMYQREIRDPRYLQRDAAA